MEFNDQVPGSEVDGSGSSPTPEPGTEKRKFFYRTAIYSTIGVVILVLIAVGLWELSSTKRAAVGKQAAVQSQNYHVQQVQNEQSLGFVPAYKEQSVPLKDVPNYEAVKQKYGLQLTPAQEKYLDQNRFLLIDEANTKFAPGVNFDDMLADFDYIGGSPNILDRAPADTKLITPDVVLHTYHKFFEMTLEQLEQKELAQSLGDFLASLRGNLLAASQASSGYTQQRYQNLLAQVTVAQVLFENKSPAKPDYFDNADQEAAYTAKDSTIDTYDNSKIILAKYTAGLTPELIGQMQAELQSIYKASDVGVSPLFAQYSDTLKTDYTQYTPRSHYTKNSALRAYFRTMMYLGRSSYFLQKDVGVTDAALLTQQFTVKSSTGIAPVDPWQKIMAVTGFYAGQSDDITYTEWQDFESKVFGSPLASSADAVSQVSVQKIVDSLSQLRLPKILSDVVVNKDIGSETKGDLLRQSLSFRIFGQRFTFDAWVLNDLTAGQEQTDTKLPSTPSALFVPAAFGDSQAQQHSQEFLQQSAGFNQADVQGFLGKLAQKQADIGKVTKGDWFASMGSAWLYVLGSLTHGYGTSYPAYMQSSAFLDKQIQTFLGSFTELKHDTLLYAKQSYAERGGGGGDGTPPPVVKGFVEPNLDFWNRFSELVANTQDVFTKNNLFADSTVSARLKNFRDITTLYASIAKQEMQGQVVSDDDYENLRATSLSFMVQPFDSATQADENTGKVALVADIHTDAVKNQVLYEGDGKPYLMLAVVGNEQSPRVVASLVYNHYEFTQPLGGQRLTDEDWRSWVYTQTDKLPAKNFWYSSLQVK